MYLNVKKNSTFCFIHPESDFRLKWFSIGLSGALRTLCSEHI